MSDNSRDSDSNGSLKSLRNRLQSMQIDRTESKRGQNHLSDLTKNIGSTLQNIFSSKSENSVYSKGVRELDNYGYEKYNIEDDSEIFISKVPDKAFFNDGEPIYVRATGGGFVGGTDNTSVKFDVGEAEAKAEDMRNLFSNVPRGTTVEKEYHATVGEITADGTVKPKPMDTSFLTKVKTSSVEKAPQAEDPVSEAEALTPETPMFLQIEDEDLPVEVPAEAEPVEEIQHADIIAVPDIVEEDVVEDDVVADVPVEPVIEEDVMVAPKKVEEFFVEDEPVIEDAVEGAEDAEDDDYSWITFEEESEQEEAQEIVACEPESVEIQAEEVHQEQVPDVPETIEEIPMEAEAVEEVMPCEAVVADMVEDVVEQVPVQETEVEETPVADEVPSEAPVAVMTLPGLREAPIEPIAGLEMEGSEPSSDSAVSEDIPVAPVTIETAETSAAVEPASTSRFVGLEEDGEAYPRLSDPVVKRPRTVRFRFNNGVLQNVESEKTEPKEELRGPLA